MVCFTSSSSLKRKEQQRRPMWEYRQVQKQQQQQSWQPLDGLYSMNGALFTSSDMLTHTISNGQSIPLVMCTTTDMENYFSSSYSITIVVLLLCLLTIHTYPIYVHISSTIDMEEDRHAVASLLWSQYPHTIRGRRRWKWLFYALCQTNEFVFREMTTISI